MNKRSIQAAALILAMSATAAVAGAQTTTGANGPAGTGGAPTSTTMHGGAMSSPMPMKSMKGAKKKNLARHGPPLKAAGANSASSSHPQSGTNIPATSGMSSNAGAGTGAGTGSQAAGAGH
jgi:hypothetical protein